MGNQFVEKKTLDGMISVNYFPFEVRHIYSILMAILKIEKHLYFNYFSRGVK